METLNKMLGYSDDAKLLIVSCDDLGVSHASNSGVFQAIREGWATTAGLMVPGPWAREAAAQYRGEDVGVHLTLNAEYELFRWGPVTQAPSLLSGEGGFPRTIVDLWDHADIDEARRECRAQVERAIYWGFDVTHIDSHLGVLALRPEFFDIALDIAVEFGLPLRLPNVSTEASIGFPFRKLAAEEGVLSPDFVTFFPNATHDVLDTAINDLQPGVSEFVFCPAADTAELRAINPQWETHATQLELLLNNNGLVDLLQQTNVQLIDYRPLRELQRAQSIS